MKTIRILLADDQDIVRTGLKAYLDTQNDLEVIAEARSGEEVLEQAQAKQPDIILMDISMPGMDGMQATRRLREMLPECQILALTVHADKQYLFEMLAAGASGYITKHSAAEELIAAIHSVAAGNIFLQPTLARWLLEDYRRLVQASPEAYADQKKPAESKRLEALSKREQQVLELVAEGFTNNEIGDKLEISPKTVARHRERIMNKLDMHSRSELVKFAIRTGLIEL